tara:strand:+ start:688 stop:993 length:306 start_codon:yes stop_codon:yes gene_type:complete
MTKHWQDRFGEWFKKLWVDEEYNQRIMEMEKKESFLKNLSDLGYAYDDGNDWYQRKWITNEGKESILEVFQPLETGEWKKLMIGYGDRVFFEEQVSESTPG